MSVVVVSVRMVMRVVRRVAVIVSVLSMSVVMRVAVIVFVLSMRVVRRVAVIVVVVVVGMTACLPMLARLSRVTIAGMNMTMRIERDMEQAASHQRLHASNHPVWNSLNQGRARHESNRGGTNHRQSQTPDRSHRTRRTLNSDCNGKANRKAVEHDRPRQQT